jgi:hypothetical protein
MVIAPSLERRRIDWMNSVAEALKKLEEKGQLRIDNLVSNEQFVDTVLHTTQTAMRDSQQEKREALRNAVLNTALPNPPDESRQQMFVEWIDTLTVWHLRILKLLDNPERWFREKGRQPPEYAFGGSLSDMLTKAYSELQNQRDLYDQITRDLHGRGLIGTENLHAMTSGPGLYAQLTTGLGREFLNFITSPAALT